MDEVGKEKEGREYGTHLLETERGIFIIDNN